VYLQHLVIQAVLYLGEKDFCGFKRPNCNCDNA